MLKAPTRSLRFSHWAHSQMIQGSQAATKHGHGTTDLLQNKDISLTQSALLIHCQYVVNRHQLLLEVFFLLLFFSFLIQGPHMSKYIETFWAENYTHTHTHTYIASWSWIHVNSTKTKFLLYITVRHTSNRKCLSN